IEVQGALLEEALTLDAGMDGVSFTSAPTSVGGALSVTSGKSVVQDGLASLSVAGVTEIVAGNADDGFADVALNHASNDFGQMVSATGGDMWLADLNDIVLGIIDVNNNSDTRLTTSFGGSLQVAAGGSIMDTAASSITVQ